MRSELFRIPCELAGVPLLGVTGVAFWLWVIGSVVFLLRGHGRASAGGDAPSTFGQRLQEHAVMLVGGAAVIGMLPRFFPAGLPIRGYGVMLLLATVTGLAMAVHRAKQHGLHPDVIYSLTFWMFVFGIAGARLFFVIEYWDVAFTGATLAERLFRAVTFTEGGLVVYGSLIGAAGVFVWRCWARGLPVLAIADLLAPSLAVGLAIGRIGCLLNGCCYGGPCEQPWAVTFPKFHGAGSQYSPPYGDQVSRGEMHGLRLAEDESTDPPQVVVAGVRSDERSDTIPPGAKVASINSAAIRSLDDARYELLSAYGRGSAVVLKLGGGASVTLPPAPVRERSLPVHPTQVYSAVNAGLLGWFLWACYPHRRRDGVIIGLLLSIYPISRFLLEIIRTDESAFLATGLSISQNVSVVILISMGLFWAWLWRLPKLRALESA